MSSPNRTPSFEEVIAQAEQALKETDQLFESHGIDPAKARAYFASITTPEMRAKADAAFNADVQAIHQEIRELTKPKVSTRPRPGRQMI